MSAFTDLAEKEFLDLLLTNETWVKVGDAAGLLKSAADGSLFATLHVLDAISDTSTLQTDNEVAYTGYARQAIARNVSDWTVAGTAPTEGSNDLLIQFGEMTAGGPDTITDISLGELTSGGGEMWIHGQVTTDLVVNDGVNPQLAIGALDVQAA